MVGLAERLPGQLGPEHLEVVRDDQLDLVGRPGLPPLEGLLRSSESEVSPFLATVNPSSRRT